MDTRSLNRRGFSNSDSREPACPRCGATMQRSFGDKRVTERTVACPACGFRWSITSALTGLWKRDEVYTEQCPHCLNPIVPSAKYCVACGRALPGVTHRLQNLARRTRAPLESLEIQAWKEDNTIARLWESVFWLEAHAAELTRRITELEAKSDRVPVEGIDTATTMVTLPESLSPSPVQADVWRAPDVPAETEEPTPETEEIELAIPVAATDLADAASIGLAPDERVFVPETELAPAGPPRQSGAFQAPARREIDLEQLVSGRGMALAGGFAVLLGAVFFLSLAFSRGWIGPELRVAMGVAVSAAMILLGARFFGRQEDVFGHVLTASGLGIMSLSMFAATRLYDIVPVELGLLGSMIAAAAAAAIAIRNRIQIVAAYGLIAALAAPPLLGASVNGVTIAMLATTLIGATAISLRRAWIWLPPAAFLLSAPQLADWIDSRPDLMPGFAALAGFWLLNALAASGEAFQYPGARLRPTSATLLVGNAAFLVWGGYTLLGTDFDRSGGLFLLCVALAHGALGSWFLRNRGASDPFGMLAFGTGVAALTMAIPVQFGGPIVPIAYAAEAAALAWVAGRLRHPYAGGTAALLGLLSIGHTLLYEYPAYDLLDNVPDARTFINGSFLTVAFQVAALSVAAYFVPIGRVRQTLAAIGLALLAYALPFELSGIWLVGGWSLLAALGFLLLEQGGWQRGEGLEGLPGRMLLAGAATGALISATVHLLLIEFAFPYIADDRSDFTPFLNEQVLAVGFVLAAIAVAGWIERGRYRLPATLIGYALILYVLPFEVSGVALVGGWAGLVLVPLWLRKYPAFSSMPAAWIPERGDRDRLATGGLMVAGAAAWLLGASHVLSIEFYEAGVGRGPGTPFADAATLAIGLLVASAVAAYLLTRDEPLSYLWILAAFAMTAALLPTQVGSAAVVVGWAALGAVSLLLAQRLVAQREIYLWTTIALAVFGLVLTLERVAPPERLFVDAAAQPQFFDHPLFWSGASAALGSVSLLLAITVRRFDDAPFRKWLGLVAGILAVYLLSVGVVDYFQGKSGSVGLEALQKRAQVALSILWATLGGVVFAAGVVRRTRVMRLFGLGLLGIATVKVFLYDLASLDASYRVLSLIGLGLLLLASSYLYLRFIGPLDQEEEQVEDWSEGPDAP